MYQVLYRKWRPQTFSDVVGQKHITTTLENELVTGRINHAYLFTGSRGTGKTTCAKILAKAVNCLNPQNGNPCGECEICRGIDSGNVLDIVEMDAASNRKIDDIRQMIDELQFKPAKCKYRVYIVDEVHMLTTEAFNALLKTLEEPPEHVVFILATTEVHKLPQTILSRCQRFDFHRISPRNIADRLLYVASQENVTLSDSAALLAAAIADGAMRDALSLLDRCIAISSDIDEDVVRNAAGLVRKDYLFDLAACVINKNTQKALEIIDRLYSDSKDMARLCDELIAHFRALMLIKSVNNPRNIIVMSDDEFEQAQTQADYLSLADTVYFMDVLSRAYQRMGKGTGDRSEFEMTLVKLSAPELDASQEALVARVAALEKAVKSGLSVSSVNSRSIQNTAEQTSAADDTANETSNGDDLIAAKPETEKEQEIAKPIPKNHQAPVAKPAPKPVENNAVNNVPNTNIDDIYKNAKPFIQWAEVLNNLKPLSRTLAAAFTGTSAYESGDYLLIDNGNEMAFELLKNSNRRQEIRNALLESTGRVFKLGPYKKPKKTEKKVNPLQVLKESLENSDVEITES